MSEAEKKRRLDYRKNRKKWIIIQIIAISIATVLALGSFIAFFLLNKTFYIHYNESANVDYKVGVLEKNEFFTEDWLEPGKSYISDNTNNILATFNYNMSMDESKATFKYLYTIDAETIILDKSNGKQLAHDIKSERLSSAEGVTKTSRNEFEIHDQVNVNFKHFNDQAKEYLDRYGLKDNGYTGTLAVTMRVSLVSSSPNFEESGNNSYFMTMNIPLGQDTFDINVSSSVTNDTDKVIACSQTGVNPALFKAIGIIFAILVLLALIFLVVFIYITRNEDINYSIKIKRILSAYRSFIQRISNEFDSEGYQVLCVNTFNEMLGIRDTIQSPILMNENEDKTRTLFFIPTNTKILYVHEIKVDNYDDLYNTEEPIVEEEIVVEEPVILVTDVEEEAIEEALATPDVDLAAVEFIPDDDPEEEEGVEVIGVVWPERAHKNKVYRYDPNGEQLSDGDVVLVPTHDASKNKDVVRKAAVAHGNHKVPPEMIHHPLKKIIGVVKHKAEELLTNNKNSK